MPTAKTYKTVNINNNVIGNTNTLDKPNLKFNYKYNDYGNNVKEKDIKKKSTDALNNKFKVPLHKK